MGLPLTSFSGTPKDLLLLSNSIIFLFVVASASLTSAMINFLLLQHSAFQEKSEGLHAMKQCRGLIGQEGRKRPWGGSLFRARLSTLSVLSTSWKQVLNLIQVATLSNWFVLRSRLIEIQQTNDERCKLEEGAIRLQLRIKITYNDHNHLYYASLELHFIFPVKPASDLCLPCWSWISRSIFSPKVVPKIPLAVVRHRMHAR